MKIISFFSLLTMLLFLAAPTSVSATIYHVPDDYNTIQGAIEAAADGDTVIVNDGVYTEHINFLGKAIVVESLSGAENTTIDGGDTARVVTIDSGEAEGTVLKGFTITNGHPRDWGDKNGGGILILSSSPRIEDCVIEGNQAAEKGGGIFIELSIFEPFSVTFKNCVIRGNTAGEAGGGMYAKASSISYNTASIDITDCTFENNTAMDDGGGVLATIGGFSTLTIGKCTVTNNTATNIGGGLFVTVSTDTGSANIKECVITDNSAVDYDGGGVVAKNNSATLLIDQCMIATNSAKRGGGGVLVNGNPEIIDCKIMDNTAGGSTLFGGGGIYAGTYATLNMVNCQITGNTTTQPDSKGGGIYIGNNASANIDHCVIENNSANGSSASGGGISLSSTWSYPIMISNSIIHNNTAMGSGGGVYSNLSSPYLYNCEIISNVANAGGGVFLYHANDDPHPTFERCKFVGNKATVTRGGGFYTYEADPVILNCLFVRNSASSGSGGAVFVSSDTLIVKNSTFTENSATSGGAVYSSVSPIVMTNCITWGNLPGELSGFFGNFDVTFSDVQGGWAGTGNINSDPLFVGDGDYRLTASSPCVDTATDAGVYTDLDGNVRPHGAGFDMGAYEYITLSPDIQANDSNGPVTILQGEQLKITISMVAGGMANEPMDWWCVADTPFGWYYYNYSSGEWLPGFKVSYKGPLTDLSPTEVFDSTTLPQGSYRFYFGVDDNMNGIFDGNQYYDSVDIAITQ